MDCIAALLLHFQRPQVVFYFRGNPAALYRFLNGFVVGKGSKRLLFDIRERGIVLFNQCKTEIPRNHHIDVILVRFYRGNKVEHFRLKQLIKVICQQEIDGVPDGISAG